MGAKVKIVGRPVFAGADFTARAKDAWAGLTARERLLATLMVLLALAAAAVFAQGWSQTQRDRYATAQSDLLLARDVRRAARGGLDNVQRAQLATLTDWTTRDRNIWLARIQLEQAITNAATHAGAPDPEIRVAEGLEGDPALPLVRVEVSGPYVASSFSALLRHLADDPRTMVVDRLEIGDTDAARYRLSLLFPVEVVEERGP